MAPAWQRHSRTGVGRDFLSCFGMLRRNRKSLIYINLCIYSHLEAYTDLVGKLNKEILNVNNRLKFKKLSKITFNYFYASFLSCFTFLNRTRNLYPAPASDCLCPEGPTPWSFILLFNRTNPNILLSVKSCSLFPFTL